MDRSGQHNSGKSRGYLFMLLKGSRSHNGRSLRLIPSHLVESLLALRELHRLCTQLEFPNLVNVARNTMMRSLQELNYCGLTRSRREPLSS